MDDLFKDLNLQQKEAVETTEGPVLIIAGPGSGKTKVLTHRVAYLIHKGIKPENILAVTFTNKASQEMKERIVRLLKAPSALMPRIGTFHSLAAQLLRINATALKIKGDFVIYDSKDSSTVMKKILKDLQIPSETLKPATALETISQAKNELINSKQYFEKANNFHEENVAKAYIAYQRELEKNNAVDFDDLLVILVNALTTNNKLLEKYHNLFHYILVDEYQDVNYIQYLLIKLLAKKNGNIFVIGDSDQSIYTWRGADYRNILNFEKDWPNTKVIILEQSYRSTQNILDAAHQIISQNMARHEKKLWTENPTGHPIIIFEASNERGEGSLIAEKIKSLQDNEQIPLKNVALLYRTNAQSRALEEAFLESGLPYKIIGGIKFYERQEIKDILAYMRLTANVHDSLSLLRIINIPPRGIGKVLQEQILTKQPLSTNQQTKADKFLNIKNKLYEIARTSTLSELIVQIINMTEYESYLHKSFPDAEARIENVQELLSVASRYEEHPPLDGLVTFLEEAALIQAQDEVETKKDLVNLMTLHAAKGLEFEVIFMVGMEEGILPHGISMLNREELEEERRLCYVGITRAKKRVFLSYARRRMMFGQTQVNLPSRFLYDLPQHLLEYKISELF